MRKGIPLIPKKYKTHRNNLNKEDRTYMNKGQNLIRGHETIFEQMDGCTMSLNGKTPS